MDSFELNKIIGAILGTLLFVMGVGFVAEAIYEPIEGNGPGYHLPEPEVALAEAGAGEEAVEEGPGLAVLLASADANAGSAASRKCQSCHTFEEGGTNKQGPNLYGVVERVIGSHPGFGYSEAFLQRQQAGEAWTYEALDAFLAAPKGYIPGTKMTFSGVRSGEERADILAYLQSLSPTPVAFPAAEEPVADQPEGEQLDQPAEGTPTTEAVATPTESQSETPVVGTPTTSGTDGSGPVEEAAPGPTEQTPGDAAGDAPADTPQLPANEGLAPSDPAAAPGNGGGAPADETTAPAAGDAQAAPGNATIPDNSMGDAPGNTTTVAPNNGAGVPTQPGNTVTPAGQ